MTDDHFDEFVRQYRERHGDACITCGAPVEKHRLRYASIAADVRPEHHAIYECGQCRTGVSFPLLTQEECFALYDSGYRQVPTGELDFKPGADDGEQGHGPQKTLLWAIQDWISRELVGRTFCGGDQRRRLLRWLLFSRPFARVFHGHPYFLSPEPEGSLAFLDFGCGQGSFLEDFPGDSRLLPEGIDSNESAVAVCRRKGLSVSCGSIDDLPRNDYQFIRAWHLLEHVARPEKYLETFREHLAPGGVLILGVPNFSPWPYRLSERWGLRQWMHIPYHRFHWNVGNMDSLLRRHGLEPLSVRSKTMGPWKVFSLANHRNVQRIPAFSGRALLALKLLEVPIDILLDLFQSGDMLEIYARKRAPTAH